jgi:hypothetical protein
MTIALGDILSVIPTLKMGAGVTIQNVYHVRAGNLLGIDEDDVLDDMDEYLTGIYSEFLSNMPDDATFETFAVKNITAGVDLGISGFGTLVDGDATTEPYAPQVSGLALGRTSVPKHVGKKYFGPLTEGSMTNAFLHPTAVANLTDAAAAAWSEFDSTLGNNYEPVILDRETGVGRPVVEYTVNNNPAIQRRRRSGYGI